jgi:hypothetical protein
MTPSDLVLRKLVEWQSADLGRQTLVIPDEGAGWSAAITADRRDEVGCRVWEVVLTRTGTAAAGATLEGWARQTAERVTSLLETLRVVEVDALCNEAQLRSEQPAWRGDRVAYFEILLTGTTQASVRRFQAGSLTSQRREQVAFALTHEALAKLVDDLTTA